MKKSVIELFAGVGGFRVGLNNITEFDENGRAIENGDWKFVFTNQWEPASKIQDAFNCYSTRFGQQHKLANVNICDVDFNQIPNANLLVGGFPCQDYSVASTLANSKGIEGKKGVLFWEIKRILETKDVPFFLLENVDRLLISPNKQKGRDFAIMLKVFQKLGYLVQWRVVNAANYGSVQKRRRVFIFGAKLNTNYAQTVYSEINNELEEYLAKKSFFSTVFPYMKASSTYKLDLGDGTSDNEIMEISDNFVGRFYNYGIMVDGQVYMKHVENNSDYHVALSSIRDYETDKENFYLSENQVEKISYQKSNKRILRIDKNTGYEYYYSEGKMSFPDEWNAPGRTLLTSETSLSRTTHVVREDNGKLRFLTPIEAERMQSFPTNWTNTGMTTKKRYFMMGNALVTLLVKKMGQEINKIFKKETK